MKQRILVILLVITAPLFLVSCEKQRERTVFGKIVYNDNKEPVNKGQFKLYLSSTSFKGASSQRKEIEYPFTTETDGSFRVLIQSKSNQSLYIRPTSSLGEIWYGDFSKKQLEINAGTIEIAR